jgi:CBS domain-containing protein
LGFSDVYDFVAGKAAWAGAGLPLEGSRSSRRAGHLARRDAPVCAVDDTLGDVPSSAAEWGLCVVQDPGGCLLGVVPAGKLALGPDTAVADVMEKAPPTLRPSTTLDDLRIRFARSGASHFVVTTLSGHVVGVVRRGDVDGA